MDINILNFFQNFRSPGLDTFFKYFTALGDHGEIWILICGIFLFTKKYRKAGFLGLLALLIEAILVMIILKPLFMRLRPFEELGIDIIIKPPLGSSFPSGHAASSFAVAFVLYFNKVPYRKVILALATLMAFSRVYLYVHYPSDILFGLFIGLGIAILLKIYQKEIICFFKPIFVKMKLIK